MLRIAVARQSGVGEEQAGHFVLHVFPAQDEQHRSTARRNLNLSGPSLRLIESLTTLHVKTGAFGAPIWLVSQFVIFNKQDLLKYHKEVR